MSEVERLVIEGVLLTVEDVAKRLHVGKSTVWNLISKEGLPSVKVGKRRLVREVDLNKWVEDRVESE
jgi:excisionase family DNA binding protein